MVMPAQTLDGARGHEALRVRAEDAIEKLASDEGLLDPEGMMASFDADVRRVLENGNPEQIRGVVGHQAAVQIKMRRGGPPSDV